MSANSWKQGGTSKFVELEKFFRKEYKNSGGIGTNGKPATNTWVHSDFIQADLLVKCGNFIGNASVLNVAYYKEKDFDSFISGQSLLNGEKTKADLAYPEGTNFIVISTDPSRAELYAYTVLAREIESLAREMDTVNYFLDENGRQIEELEIISLIKEKQKLSENEKLQVQDNIGIISIKNETYINKGYIGKDGVLTGISSTWVHSDFIQADLLVKCGNFIGNASVLNVAYYKEKDFDSFISGQSLLNGEKTKADLAYPEGTNFIVISTNGNNSNKLYAELIIDKNGQKIKQNADDIKKIRTLSEQNTLDIQNLKNFNSKGFLHFSFDDTIYTLKDIIDKSYDSIFEQPFFAVLKDLHNRFGAVFSCYCFLDYKVDGEVIFSLEDFVEPKFGELKENLSWLKFGLHSKDSETNYSNGTEENVKVDYDRFIK